MHYTAVITREGDQTNIEFPDCPGCITFATKDENVADVAREALEGWLEAHLVDGEAPPQPRIVELLSIEISSELVARIRP